MIKFEKVTKQYPDGYVALQEVDLFINKGEFVSIVGRSGAGKSTLLKLIYAEEYPTEGRVFFNDRPIDVIKRWHLPYFRRNIGTIFQDFKLLSKKNVFENISYALEVAGDSNEEIMKKIPKILDIVKITDKALLYPHQLSGGEQQRVSIARALIHNPQVIIADEPTGNLDPVSGWEIVQLLTKINKFGTTVILATHNKSIVDNLKKRVVAIDKGKIIRDQENGRYVI